MKKILLLVAVALSSQLALASNYPSDYCDQSVVAIHEGPALFAHVGSGCLSGDVIGYKNNQVLSRSNPSYIDAIVIIGCNTGSGSATRTMTVRLGREYRGNGYVSDGNLDLRSMGYNMCFGGSITYQIAFSDGKNNWDSNYGRNYHINPLDFSQAGGNVVRYNTHEGSGFGKINLKAWAFIVDQLRR